MALSSPSNAEYLKTIESAVRVLCLDDGSPNTPEEIARQAFMGDGFNRWFDKVLQFVVSANGRSGLIYEHSGIDGLTYILLLQWIDIAIHKFSPSPNGTNTASETSNSESEIDLKELILTTTPTINHRITVLKDSYATCTAGMFYIRDTFTEFGTSFLLHHNLPAKQVVDLTFQLAIRLFFGHNVHSFEAFSIAYSTAAAPSPCSGPRLRLLLSATRLLLEL